MELIHDLLSSADEDIKKTRLRYKSKMAHIQFNKYLDSLIEKELINKKEAYQEGITYHITDDGVKLLESLEVVLTRLK